jgi:hypothetical protein
MDFEESVFVNCPFDDQYMPILRPVLFCILYLGLYPRIALETLNSGEPRVEKIITLIRASKYGIHDLSRLKSEKRGEFFRLNMPFELGLDVGCRLFGGKKWKDKRCLILETERYRFQAAISDLSNSDIKVHKNEPEQALTAVRDWLVVEASLTALGASAVWAKFNDFMADDYDALIARGFSEKNIANQSMGELMPRMKTWVEAQR